MGFVRHLQPYAQNNRLDNGHFPLFFADDVNREGQVWNDLSKHLG